MRLKWRSLYCECLCQYIGFIGQNRYVDRPSKALRQMSVPALFLDRDGVINLQSWLCIQKREEFEFIDGIFDVARYACPARTTSSCRYHQPSRYWSRLLHRGAEFHQLTECMCEQFSKAVGAPISRVYFSPYQPTAGQGKYLRDDFSRKPHPGMILQAQKDLALDLSCSVQIGDNVSDIQSRKSG
jgi:D-glycero-D-manno-heptose 1,7-bisphosphate phosphatase